MNADHRNSWFEKGAIYARCCSGEALPGDLRQVQAAGPGSSESECPLFLPKSLNYPLSLRVFPLPTPTPPPPVSLSALTVHVPCII